jgi:ribosomal-protein-alanine N-acetyltransferase
MTITIKHLAEVHLEAVKAIERSCFPKPWSPEVFDTLARWHGRILLDGGKLVCMDVAEETEITIGYIAWEENRITLKGRIMNIAVRQASRRKGIGQLLLTHALRTQKMNGMKICKLEVRESNHSAMRLYERLKMNAIGRESRYYETEDAIIYSINLEVLTSL